MLIYVFLFIIGSIIGSFLNVCIYRIPREESIAFPPSHCTNCGTRIKWYDLVPVLSFLFLKGRCRYCKNKISVRYPLIEVLTGIVFLAIFNVYGFSFEAFKFIFLCSLLIVISFIDMDTQDIYFKTSLTGIISALIFLALGYFSYTYGLNQVLMYLCGGFVVGGIVLIIAVLTKGMGLGDVEVYLFCGFYLGLKKGSFMLLLSFIIGAVYGITAIALKFKNRKDYVPFVPFISIAVFIMILYGDNIINWYLEIVSI